MNTNEVPCDESNARFFTERQTPSVHFSLGVRNRLLSKQTLYQHLELFETEEFGRLMALDGKIMLTERDERFYHEMLVHPALLTHSHPQSVVVIGGGDGGTVREVLKHPSIEHVLWVEIDGEVVAAAREYLPSVCAGVFEDRRVELRITPGEQLMARLRDTVDVIIVDSTDPVGPAVPLFESDFLQASARALRNGGIYVSQCGSPFFHPEHIGTTHGHLRRIFSHVRIYLGFVPCYPSMWSYCMASDAPMAVPLETIKRRCHESDLRATYFSPELYYASAVLPQFLLDHLRG
jgi:spermidine synthase